MAIEGPLRELGIHDVFQLLDLSRKTGRLRVTSALRDNEGTVFFREGRIVSASIHSNPHAMGTMLVQAGRISEEQLATARAAHVARGESRSLGELLVAQGVISARELERQLRQQVEAVVFELMSWQEGFFSFAELPRDQVPGDGATSVATEALLMEAARRIDEWGRMAQRIPHVGVVPVLADVNEEHPSMLDLRPNEWEVLAAIDGRSDLRTVAAQLGRSDFEVARIAFGLVTTGVITIAEAAPARMTAAEPAELVTLLGDVREALRDGRVDDALSLGATAVAVAPGDGEGHALLARALLAAGREGEGEDALRRALELDPGNLVALMVSARRAVRRGDLSDAIACWRRVVDAAPSSVAASQARDAMAHASRLNAVLEGADA